MFAFMFNKYYYYQSFYLIKKLINIIFIYNYLFFTKLDHHVYDDNIVEYNLVSSKSILIKSNITKDNNYRELSSEFVKEDIYRWSSNNIVEDYEDFDSSNFLYSSKNSSLINKNLSHIYEGNKELYRTINITSINNVNIPYDIYITNITIPLYEIKNSLFVCNIKVGELEEEFWPIIDTGSSNLWIIGEECTQSSCQKVKRYSKYSSNSFKRISKYDKISVVFGTGKIFGKLILETLKFDNFQLNEHVIGIIEEVENTENSKIDVFDAIELEGVLGLGFHQMSSSKNLQLPLMERLQSEGLINKNIFALYINDYRIKPTSKKNKFSSPSALLLLDGIDPNFYYGDIHMLPVIREHYWQVEIESLFIGETKYCCDQGSLAYEWESLEKDYLQKKFGSYEDLPMEYYIYKKYSKTIDTNNRIPGYVIFDSGTSFFTLPKFEYKHFFDEYKPFGDCSQIHLDYKKISKNILSHFPNITYKFKDGFELIITPELYLTPDEKGKCKPGFMPIEVPAEYGHSYLLGSLFMRSYFTVYAKNIPNVGSAVGIARAKHSKEVRKYIYNKLSIKNDTFVPPDDDEAEMYWTKFNGRLSRDWKFPEILSNMIFS